MKRGQEKIDEKRGKESYFYERARRAELKAMAFSKKPVTRRKKVLEIRKQPKEEENANLQTQMEFESW